MPNITPQEIAARYARPDRLRDYESDIGDHNSLRQALAGAAAILAGEDVDEATRKAARGALNLILAQHGCEAAEGVSGAVETLSIWIFG